MRKLKSVSQIDGCGCWLAAASMLTGVDYNQLRAEFDFQGEVTGRSAGPLKDLLAIHGVVVDDKSTRISKNYSLEILNCHALVYGKAYFKNKKKRFVIAEKPPGHWMVWDAKERVLRDPAGHDGQMIVEVRNFRRVLELP